VPKGLHYGETKTGLVNLSTDIWQTKDAVPRHSLATPEWGLYRQGVVAGPDLSLVRWALLVSNVVGDCSRTWIST
jgi:hypothetical protein